MTIQLREKDDRLRLSEDELQLKEIQLREKREELERLQKEILPLSGIDRSATSVGGIYILSASLKGWGPGISTPFPNSAYNELASTMSSSDRNHDYNNIVIV